MCGSLCYLFRVISIDSFRSRAIDYSFPSFHFVRPWSRGATGCGCSMSLYLTVGIRFDRMQLSQTHSADASVVRRSYAFLLIPVQTRWNQLSHPLSHSIASSSSRTSLRHIPHGYWGARYAIFLQRALNIKSPTWELPREGLSADYAQSKILTGTA